MILDFIFPSPALKTLPIGTAYAVWTGIYLTSSPILDFADLFKPDTAHRPLYFFSPFVYRTRPSFFSRFINALIPGLRFSLYYRSDKTDEILLMAIRYSEGCFPAKILGVAKAAEFRLTETAYAPRHSLPKHSHEHACFVVVLRGTFSETYESNSRECEPLTIIFRPPHEIHRDIFSNRSARCLNIEVSEQWLGRVSAYSRALNHSADFRGHTFSKLATRLDREYRQMDEASPLMIEGLLLEIVAESARRAACSTAAGRPPCWLARAEEMIRAHFSEPLTLTGIAAAVDAHPLHLSALFRQTYGCTVGEYTRRLRIEFAAFELSRSERPIIEIALAAGFYDQSHFSRTFKRHTGLTPAAYRAIHSAT